MHRCLNEEMISGLLVISGGEKCLAQKHYNTCCCRTSVALNNKTIAKNTETIIVRNNTTASKNL